MTQVEAARRLLLATPGIVTHETFVRFGVASHQSIVRRLRAAGLVIETVHGLGYRLKTKST